MDVIKSTAHAHVFSPFAGTGTSSLRCMLFFAFLIVVYDSLDHSTLLFALIEESQVIRCSSHGEGETGVSGSICYRY
jgi:hypothetical protein